MTPPNDAALIFRLLDTLGLNVATATTAIRIVREAGLPLEKGETVTPADRWQAVARNLAQVLEAAASDIEGCKKMHLDHAILRTAFTRQCEAHGLKP